MVNYSDWLTRVNRCNLKNHLFYLAKTPLPCRQLNYTIPGHVHCTLYEADQFIEQKLMTYGYPVTRETIMVQAFQPDPSAAHGFRKPLPSEPWYPALNLYARKTGRNFPNELIIIVAHKDSQSWLPCAPGASDNAIGTVGILELARILQDYPSKRTIWFLFCNEEHWPWTSVHAAESIARAAWKWIAMLNIDGIGGKANDALTLQKPTHVVRYSTEAGKKIAELFRQLNETYRIGLELSTVFSEKPNDDDGSFINAGVEAAVMNIGSYPYAEPNYHTLNDRPENIDLDNVVFSLQLCLAVILHLDEYGFPG